MADVETIRKGDDGHYLAIPEKLLAELGVSPGDPLSLVIVDRKLIVSRISDPDRRFVDKAYETHEKAFKAWS